MPAEIKENSGQLCFVFPMGMEQYPFLKRVEVRKRWKSGNAIFREAFFEGRIVLVIRSGIGPEKAAAALRKLQTRPSAVLSVGTAGGLVPDLKIRDLIVSEETLYGHEPEHCRRWHRGLVEVVSEACRREGCRYRIGRIATVNDAVFPREDRLRLNQSTGASAVDMESHAIGLEALKLGIPFASLRVISDDFYSRPLPDLKSVRIQWNNPHKWPKTMIARYRRRAFLKRFGESIEMLHPVLVRIIREFGSARVEGPE